MKKLFLSALLTIAVNMAFSQGNPAADSLQQYVGTYKFPDGGPVSETAVTVKDGVLYASSPEGETELAKTEVPDVFSVVVYSGLATFKRNGDGKVVGVKIEVGDMIFEGTKQESIAAGTPLRQQAGSIVKK